MNVEYIETDYTDGGRIDWYEIDGATYGKTHNWSILDSDGVPVANDSALRQALDIHYQQVI